MESTTENLNAIKLYDPVFGDVVLDFAWRYTAEGQPNPGWHVRMSGTGSCSRGSISKSGNGISYDSLLFRYGVDVLGIGGEVDPVLIVALVDRHLATSAKINVMRAFGCETDMN